MRQPKDRSDYKERDRERAVWPMYSFHYTIHSRWDCFLSLYLSFSFYISFSFLCFCSPAVLSLLLGNSCSSPCSQHSSSISWWTPSLYHSTEPVSVVFILFYSSSHFSLLCISSFVGLPVCLFVCLFVCFFLHSSFQETRVQVLVHNTHPPFLDGRILFTTQSEPVSVVKDPTSDMAMMARRGSKLLNTVREQNERARMRDRFWELAGSHQGNLIGIQQKQDEDEVKNE